MSYHDRVRAENREPIRPRGGGSEPSRFRDGGYDTDERGRESDYRSSRTARSSSAGLFDAMFGDVRPQPISWGRGDNQRNERDRYSYSSGGASKAVEQDTTIQAYEDAYRSLYRYRHHVYNRTDLFGKAIHDAMDIFQHPCGMKTADPVFKRFIEDLKSFNEVYVSNIATFIFMAMVNAIANGLLTHGKLLSPPDLCSKITNATLRLLLAEFGNWLLTSDDGWYMYRDMSPLARKKLDDRDDVIASIGNMVAETATGSGEINKVNIPWKTDIIKLLEYNRPSTSPIVDVYLGDRSHFSADDDYFEGVTTPSVTTSVDDYRRKQTSWDQNAFNAYKEIEHCLGNSVSEAIHTRKTSTGSGAFDYNDNWSNAQAATTEEEKPSDDHFITVENFHKYDRSGVNFLKWFVPIPGLSDTYLVHPLDFNIISRHLINIGDNEDYCDGVRLLANTMPVVELNWNAGTYKYSLVTVGGRKEMTLKLTNPETILPLLETRSEEEVFAEYQAESATLEELEAKRLAAAHDPNAVKEMATPPQVIYANKPSTFNRRQGMNAYVNALNNTAEKKCGKEVNAVALPFVDCAQLEVEHVTMKEIQAIFPFLVSGNEFTYSFEELLAELNETLTRKISTSEFKDDWRYIQYYLNRHICTVINRWLVEERYYGATRKDKNFLAISDAYNYGSELQEEIRKEDLPSCRVLQSLHMCRTLVEQIQLFASEEEMAGFASICTDDNVDESIRDAYKENIMDTSVVVTTAGVLVRVNSFTPLDADGPKVFERSSNPELLHIIENAPTKVAKHFKRRVGVFVTFGKDIGKTIWVATFSGESPDKVMLVPVRSDQSLALRRTSISEITFTRPGEED